MRSCVLTESYALAKSIIDKEEQLRGYPTNDAAHIRDIESALLHTRELIHSQPTEHETYLNKVHRRLEGNEN